MADCDLATVSENTQEIWKDIPGYEGRYSVSNLGRVMGPYRNRCNFKNRTLSLSIMRDGYKLVILTKKDGSQKGHLVHRLVMLAFFGPCPKGHEVNHIDFNRGNNVPENLEYVTPRQNMLHSMSRHARGATHGSRTHTIKLREDDVREIKKLFSFGERQVDIAKKYNVTKNMIYLIVRGKEWTHVV